MMTKLLNVLAATMPALMAACASAPVMAGPRAHSESVGSTISAPPPDSYRVFTGAGAVSSLDSLLTAARNAEVLLLGEAHDDRIGHALQHEIVARLLAASADGHGADGAGEAAPPGVVLSLEMFERDVQTVVEEYLSGLIREDHFLRAARPWPHYEQDYRPLVELARSHQARVIAANPPRRYVNLVAREGAGALRKLSAEAREWLPPLPFAPPSNAYRARFEAEMAAHGAGSGGLPGAENMLLAQTLWDAGMAYSVAESLLHDPGATVVHLAGAFHVSFGLGLPEHLERYRPGTRVLTLVVQPEAERDALPATLSGAADFVILTDPAYVRDQPVP